MRCSDSEMCGYIHVRTLVIRVILNLNPPGLGVNGTRTRSTLVFSCSLICLAPEPEPPDNSHLWRLNRRKLSRGVEERERERERILGSEKSVLDGSTAHDQFSDREVPVDSLRVGLGRLTAFAEPS